MHLPAHLAASWMLGHRQITYRDRCLIAWAGVAPDADALSLLWGQEAYANWHHVLGHGLVGAAVVVAVVAAAARQRPKTAALALVAFHLHLLLDLAGSGREWGIVYFYPWSRWEAVTQWGWPLASWQNFSVMLGLFALSVPLALSVKRTFAEVFLGRRVDAAIVATLVARFGRGRASEGAEPQRDRSPPPEKKNRKKN